jgi:hypothetical protein
MLLTISYLWYGQIISKYCTILFSKLPLITCICVLFIISNQFNLMDWCDSIMLVNVHTCVILVGEYWVEQQNILFYSTIIYMMEMQIRACERQNLELAKQEWMPTPPPLDTGSTGEFRYKKKPCRFTSTQKDHTLSQN